MFIFIVFAICYKCYSTTTYMLCSAAHLYFSSICSTRMTIQSDIKNEALNLELGYKFIHIFLDLQIDLTLRVSYGTFSLKYQCYIYLSTWFKLLSCRIYNSSLGHECILFYSFNVDFLGWLKC